MLLTFLDSTKNETDFDENVIDNFIFPPLPHWVRTLQALVYIAEFILGVSLNTFLILLILFRKSLRNQRGSAVTLQILIVNLAFTIPVLSTCAQSALAGEWTLGDGFCQFIAFCNESLQPQRWLLTAVLVIDRALVISWPFKYEKYYGAKVVTALSLLALSLGFLLGLLPPIVPALRSCNDFAQSSNTCHISFNSQHCGRFLLGYSTVTIFLGGVVPFALYIWMVCKTKKHNRQIAPAPGEQVNSLSSAIPIRQSQKQLITMLLLFWTLLGCTLPLYLSVFLTFLATLLHSPSGMLAGYYITASTNLMYYGIIVADPIALMWHKDIKQELRIVKRNMRAYFKM